MKCSMHHSPDTLLKADEPAYLAIAVLKENNKVHIDEYGYIFASESDLGKTVKKFEERMRGFQKSGEWEIACAEIKDSTTDAKKEIFRRYGVEVVESEYPSREEWSTVLDRLVSLARDNDSIMGLYLTGSLAKDDQTNKNVPRKDADVLMHVRKCPGFLKCEVFRRLVCSDPELMNKRVHKPDPRFQIRKQNADGEKDYSLDVFCFENGEFEELEQGNYRIAQNKKPLFQKV